jgi:hypothetical protein
MGWTNRTRQTKIKVKKKGKLIRKRVVAIALLVITLTLFSVNKVGTPFKSPTPEPTKATMEEKKANKVLAKSIAWLGYGWKDKEWVCLDNLFIKESRYDNYAKNKKGSTAFGMGQLLGETSKDPTIQLLKTYKYIQHRYKTPCSAWRWHLHHNWY